MIAPSVDLQTKPSSPGFVPLRTGDAFDSPNKTVPARRPAEENQSQFGNSAVVNDAEQAQSPEPALDWRASGSRSPTSNLPSQAPQQSVPNSSVSQYLTPTVDPSSSETIFDSFSRSTATDVATQLGWLGDKVSTQFHVDRTQFAESAPPITVSIEGSQAQLEEGAINEGASSTMPTADSIVLDPAPPGKLLDATATTVPPQPADDSVSTEIGPAPQFRMDGEANPAQMNSVNVQSRQVADEASRSVSESIQGNQAANRIVAEPLHRAEEIAVSATKTSLATSQSTEMAEYLLTDVGSDARAIAESDFAPTLEATLAAPREQVQQAALTRDDTRQQALTAAQQQADEASSAAAQEQQQSIAQGQALVEQEKKAGLAEQRAELERFEGDVTSAHQTQKAEIKRTVADEQSRADQAIGDGKKQAEEKQAAAQRLADEEKQKAEADKPQEERNWWGKLTSWFKNAIRDWTDKLVGAIKRVFDAAKSAVNTVLTAAKNLAVGIIKALRETVVGMIQAFAAGLKLMVSALLIAFPKIREKVIAAIDSVVTKAIEVVDAIAKRLEDSVVAIVDGLQSTINKALDLFELVIVTQIQIVGAVLSGNFMEAALILFRAACKSVGIPADEFIGILRDARDAFLDIIKRPAKFLGYLISAMGQGMKIFFANFPQRMIAGLTGWLFGMVASAGMTLPKSFDLKSIFMLLLQVMGITYEYIRGKVVALVGEQTVERIEQIMTPIRILFTEGPGALWQWIGDQVAVIKDKIVEAVSQWVVTQVIQQAMIKLASMFTPVGAFVQAVLMMYNTVMFFVSKITEIFAWVKSITSSLKTIAIGAIAAAANYIDQSMSKSIPLIIDFLARLVGINGIGEKIREIVTKLRAPIDKGIAFVVTKIIELAKKAWGGIKAGASAVKQTVSDWWNAKKEFTTDSGEHHELYLSGDGEQRQLIIASTPEQFTRYLKKLESLGTVDNRVIFDLRWRHTELEKLASAPKPETEKEASDRRTEVLYKMAALAEILQRMPRVEEQLSEAEMIARFSAGLGLEAQECRVFMADEGITAADIASFAADMTPAVGTSKSVVELFSGTDPITGKEASRWWAAVGLIPFGKLGKRAELVSKIFRKRIGRARSAVTEIAPLVSASRKFGKRVGFTGAIKDRALLDGELTSRELVEAINRTGFTTHEGSEFVMRLQGRSNARLFLIKEIRVDQLEKAAAIGGFELTAAQKLAISSGKKGAKVKLEKWQGRKLTRQNAASILDKSQIEAMAEDASRLEKTGIETLGDLGQVLNDGLVASSRDGRLLISHPKGDLIVDESTRELITILVHK